MKQLSKASIVGETYFLKIQEDVVLTVDTTHEDMTVAHAFAGCGYSRQRIQGMQRSLDNETAIHVSVTITATREGMTEGEAHLGSCWDKDVYTMLKGGIHGYLPQLIEEAIEDMTEITR